MWIVHGVWDGKRFGIWAENNEYYRFASVNDLYSLAEALDFYPEFKNENIIFPVDSNGNPVFYDYSSASGVSSFEVTVAKARLDEVFKILRLKKVKDVLYSSSMFFWRDLLKTTLELVKSGDIVPTLNVARKRIDNSLMRETSLYKQEIIWKPLIEDNDIINVANKAPPDAFLENSERLDLIKSFIQEIIHYIVSESLSENYNIILSSILKRRTIDPYSLIQDVKKSNYTLYFALLYNDEGGKIISGLFNKDENTIITFDVIHNNEYLKRIYYDLLSSTTNMYYKLNGLFLGEVNLDAKELDDFLEIVPKLRHRGFKVFTKIKRIRPIIRINSDSYGVSSRNMLSDFDYKISIGDKDISEEEFMKLVSENRTIVELGGNLVEIDEKSLQKIKDLLYKIKSKKIDKIDILRESLLGDIEINDELLDRLRGNKSFQLLEPYNIKANLRPYQIKGFSWMRFMNKLGFGICLADDMGLGKTLQTIAVFSDAKKENELTPSLVICPLSVLKNWEEELSKFAPHLRFAVFHEDRSKIKLEDYDIILTTYAVLLRDTRLKEVEWKYIVIDEAQNIKNPQTKIFKAVKELKSKYRIALTGTPIENKVDDLWSIMTFLNPGLLGSYSEFKSKFATPIKKGDNMAKEELKAIISPFILRRTKYDKAIINDLPDKIETNVYCNLTPEQAAMYKAEVENLFNNIDSVTGIKRKGMILSTLLKLKQIVDHPALLKGGEQSVRRSGKMIRTMEIIEEALDEGDKIAIFTQFVDMGKIIRNIIEKELNTEVPFLYGELSKKERDDIISKFQNNPSVKFIVLSVKAGGFGINLTSANRVIHFDRWWNPAVEDQATDRVYRIGQTRNVIVHKLISVGTLEEKIDQLLAFKRSLFKDIISSGDSWITELSTEELRKVIELSVGGY
ncbi:DEAD/DEAH box helicase [Saccharolobus solfataricus]